MKLKPKVTFTRTDPTVVHYVNRSLHCNEKLITVLNYCIGDFNGGTRQKTLMYERNYFEHLHLH
jgi:hypothetical protein